MEHLKLNLILFLMLMAACWIQVTSRIDEYTVLETGQNITGKVTAIYMTNPMDCIRR